MWLLDLKCMIYIFNVTDTRITRNHWYWDDLLHSIHYRYQDTLALPQMYKTTRLPVLLNQRVATTEKRSKAEPPLEANITVHPLPAVVLPMARRFHRSRTAKLIFGSEYPAAAKQVALQLTTWLAIGSAFRNASTRDVSLIQRPQTLVRFVSRNGLPIHPEAWFTSTPSSSL